MPLNIKKMRTDLEYIFIKHNLISLGPNQKFYYNKLKLNFLALVKIITKQKVAQHFNGKMNFLLQLLLLLFWWQFNQFFNGSLPKN